jgi:hypothetical protein
LLQYSNNIQQERVPPINLLPRPDTLPLLLLLLLLMGVAAASAYAYPSVAMTPVCRSP